jgi:hypothetical protein
MRIFSPHYGQAFRPEDLLEQASNDYGTGRISRSKVIEILTQLAGNDTYRLHELADEYEIDIRNEFN